MILQYSTVFIILLAAIVYIIYRIRQTIREAKSGCYGCKGCALKEQMMQRRMEKGIKSRKNTCFEKKYEKHLAVSPKIYTFALAIKKQRF